MTNTLQSALLAGVLTSTGSWPNILPNGEASPWSVRTSWYCGIILSLFSILSAADQTVRLHRLSSHRDGLAHLRKLLASGKHNSPSKTGSFRPSLVQIMTWQMPVMFLTTATICMIVGMFLHVWSATTHLKRPNLWDDNTKVCLLLNECSIFTLTFTLGRSNIHCGRYGFHHRLLHRSSLSLHNSPELIAPATKPTWMIIIQAFLLSQPILLAWFIGVSSRVDKDRTICRVEGRA
jgi:hypothetical protein